MKGRRNPYRLRADGKMKGLHVERAFRAKFGAWIAFYTHDRPIPPAMDSAERTRSGYALAGSRRTKRRAGAR